MTTNLAFDFSVNKANRTITVKREFAAELSLVWEAYTNSEILDKWWAPKPWKTKTKSMNFKEGGRWNYAMVGPAGEEHWCIVNYTTIQFQKKFTGLDSFADVDGNIREDMPQSRWEVSFVNQGQTTLVITQITYDELAQLEEVLKMGFKEGYAMAMETLDELLPSLKNKN